MKKLTGYLGLIVEFTGCSHEEAPKVEEMMRVQARTLDNLDRESFRDLAKLSLQAVRA